MHRFQVLRYDFQNDHDGYAEQMSTCRRGPRAGIVESDPAKGDPAEQSNQ